jgi:hypothetical protein
MTVKKKSYNSIENFIDKGAAVKSNNNKKFKNVLIRIPSEILSDLDTFLLFNRPWETRTQWIVEAIHEKLQKQDK